MKLYLYKYASAFKAFFELLCVELGKRVPKRKASTILLEIDGD